MSFQPQYAGPRYSGNRGTRGVGSIGIVPVMTQARGTRNPTFGLRDMLVVQSLHVYHVYHDATIDHCVMARPRRGVVAGEWMCTYGCGCPLFLHLPNADDVLGVVHCRFRALPSPSHSTPLPTSSVTQVPLVHRNGKDDLLPGFFYRWEFCRSALSSILQRIAEVSMKVCLRWWCWSASSLG